VEGQTRPGRRSSTRPYCAAKFAVEGLLESLAPVAAQVGVDVCIVEPGAVSTRFVANVGVDPRR
jgi:NAD(P)-dependent dehydrogenase (short-subunit alcohol dehydrogenase family)